MWSNVTALPIPTDDVSALLVAAGHRPGHVCQILEGMAAAGATRFVHVGPGDVTTAMAKRTVPDAEVMTVNSIGEIDETVERLMASVR